MLQQKRSKLMTKREAMAWALIAGAIIAAHVTFAAPTAKAVANKQVPIVAAVECPEGINELITRVARERHIDPVLFHSLAVLESSKNPKAINKKDGRGGRASYGLFQLNGWWLDRTGYTSKEIMDAELNAVTAAGHVIDCLDEAHARATSKMARLVAFDGCYTAGAGRKAENWRLYSYLKKTNQLHKVTL